ncbi:hypothetical protein G7Y89_g3729 [Cudoniella acicularis]|uniref:Rhodopsin domain-containing protein n=1 Tax=Cudoniella acicularis TaxID=354080 RepID=A0A8H4W4Y1_9HELO|nr:hypothetical protein G7Y89_g3729 [Cudoniella acicularis]
MQKILGRQSITGALEPPPGVQPNFTNPPSIAKYNILCQAMLASLLGSGHLFIPGWHYLLVYVTQMFYGPQVFVTKLAILLLLSRLFGRDKRVLWTIRILIGLMAAYYIPATAAKIFICWPVAHFWNPGVQGTCLNENSIFLADCAMSIISDFTILILPMPLIWNLKMHRIKKIGITAAFGAGALACTASLLRLYETLHLNGTPDKTKLRNIKTPPTCALEMRNWKQIVCVSYEIFPSSATFYLYLDLVTLSPKINMDVIGQEDYIFSRGFRDSASDWLLELAAQISPQIELHGFDISSDLFPAKEYHPPNLTLQHLDAFGDLPENLKGKFDIVHIRAFTIVVKGGHPGKLLDNLVAMLKPGGYLQWDEMDSASFSAHAPNQLTPKTDTERLLNRFQISCAKMDLKFGWISNLSNIFEEKKLAVVESVRLPISDSLRHMSTDNFLMGLNDLGYVVSEKILGPRNEYREALNKAVGETRKGELPTTKTLGGAQKILLQKLANFRHHPLWRIMWIIGLSICVPTLITTYLQLGNEMPITVYTWIGFQLLWLVFRLVLYHVLSSADHFVFPGLLGEEWKLLTPELKTRAIGLLFALAKYQTHMHPCGSYSYEDVLSLDRAHGLLPVIRQNVQQTFPLSPAIRFLDIMIVELLGDIVLNSAAWLSGSTLTGMELYDTVLVIAEISGQKIAIPAVRALSGNSLQKILAVTRKDAENAIPKFRSAKGLINAGYGLT